MTVRPATPLDAVALAEVAAATFRLACPPSTTEEAMAAHIAAVLSESAFARHLTDPDRAVLVDDPGDGGPLVGYALLVFEEPADADVARAIRTRPTSELSKIYVREGQHGRGSAAALLARSFAPSHIATAPPGLAARWRCGSGRTRRTCGRSDSTRSTGSSGWGASGSVSVTATRPTSSSSAPSSRAASLVGCRLS